MRVGIGVSTRNRPRMMARCLRQIADFSAPPYRLVVVDDSSDKPNADQNATAAAASQYWFSAQRLGVAKAKNECLKRLTDCDWVFLLDDDCWPIQKGWEQKWITAAESNQTHHMVMMIPDKQSQPIWKNDQIEFYLNCFGSFLMFSRHALDVLGGFDPKMGLWGYEHVQVSHRANMAGLTKVHGYATIPNAKEWIHLVDMYGAEGVESGGSISQEEKDREMLIGQSRMAFQQIKVEI